MKFDNGDPNAADPVERESSRPDFVVLVYPGWRRMDLSNVPRTRGRRFWCRRGSTTRSTPRQTVEFHNALFEAGAPARGRPQGTRGEGRRRSRGAPDGTAHLYAAWGARGGHQAAKGDPVRDVADKVCGVGDGPRGDEAEG